MAGDLVVPHHRTVLHHRGAPEVGVLGATARRLQGAPDDGNAEPLEPPLHRQAAVHQQDPLPLHTIDGCVPQEVHDREVGATLSCRVPAVAPVRAARPVALAVCLDRPNVVGEVLAVQIPRGARHELAIVDVAVLRERRVRDVRVFDDRRGSHNRRVTTGAHSLGGVGPNPCFPVRDAVERVAGRPARRDVIVPADRRVARERIPSPAGERGADVDDQGLDLRQQPDPLPAAAAAPQQRRAAPEARRVLAGDVDQVLLLIEPIDIAGVAPRMARRYGVRTHRRDPHRVERIGPDTVVRLRIPMPDDGVRGSLGHAERALAVARVFAHALLLGPREERARDQRAHHDQGDDREGERHAALVLDGPLHNLLLRAHESRAYRQGLQRVLPRTATRVTTLSILYDTPGAPGWAICDWVRPRTRISIWATLDESAVTTPLAS